MTTVDINKTLIELAADLTRTYASAHVLSPQEAVTYFRETFDGLSDQKLADMQLPADLASKAATSEVREAEQKVANAETTASKDTPVPPVPIEESVQPDYLVCLENGKKFKMLKRHLRTTHNMTPEEYRLKWGLPDDYPMIAPRYSEEKSGNAKATGFGTHRRKKVRNNLRSVA